jgi:4-amino-4-deoxy-L-arabinose transferase-like glycosyltransferase
MDELKRQTRMLDDDVRKLTDETHRLNDRADRNDRDKRWLIVGLLLVVALVALVAYVAIQARRTADVQDELRAQVLCPLYSVFLGAYDPRTRDRNPDPQARQKYEDAYANIRRGWDVMGCTDPLVPPRSN